MASTDPIKHVVVLMLENRSFDQMLGDFQSIYPQLDGVDRNAEPRVSLDADGNEYQQLHTTAMTVRCDPDHVLESVLRQIGAPPAVQGPDGRGNSVVRLLLALWHAIPRLPSYILKAIVWLWRWLRPKPKVMQMQAAQAYVGHFVREYVNSFPDLTDGEKKLVMGYYQVGDLPALHALAGEFTICDQWFSSVPGPTWTNRFFFHSGTSLGIASMPHDAKDLKNYSLFDQRTLYDELNRVGKRWKIYFHSIPQSLVLSGQWTHENRTKYSPFSGFAEAAGGPAEAFPDFVVIEPQYMGTDSHDDHPPHHTMRAQQLIADVYNPVRANEELWHSTLLIVNYDEHGGFYDHVEPPKTVCPDNCQLEYSFDQLGVRVPAVLVSPWLNKGVFSEVLDHTSVGKYLSEKWGINPLGKRMAQANSIGDAFPGLTEPRTDTPKNIPRPEVPLAIQAPGKPFPENENRVALGALLALLEEQRAKRYDQDGVQAMVVLPDSTDAQGIEARVQQFIHG